MIMRGFQRNLACTGAEEAAELGVLEGRDDGMFHYSFGENKDHLSHTHTDKTAQAVGGVFTHRRLFSAPGRVPADSCDFPFPPRVTLFVISEPPLLSCAPLWRSALRHDCDTRFPRFRRSRQTSSSRPSVRRQLLSQAAGADCRGCRPSFPSRDRGTSSAAAEEKANFGAYSSHSSEG